VICFVDDIGDLFREAGRVLVHEGVLIIGFIERGGEIAKMYRNEKMKGRFLMYARFRTVDEVTRLLKDAGFTSITIHQRAQGFCVIIGRNL
jgi:SAM-dependent methyltransferase